VTEPWRNAAAMLMYLLGQEGVRLCRTLFPDKSAALKIIEQMISRKVNSPMAGTCGRLFDAVSAMLGLCHVSTYDGEAAILLSEVIGNQPDPVEPYPFIIHDGEVKELDFAPALRQLAGDRLEGLPVAAISHRFHETVVAAASDVTRRIAAEHPEYGRRVVLSGGSFNNPYLARRIAESLRTSGFTVYTHHRVPCGDGGLCLGQLAVAAAQQVKWSQLSC
jgi:Hydrogenase maturation factor